MPTSRGMMVVSLGWETFHLAGSTRFWATAVKQAAEESVVVNKRPYNNTNRRRAAEARAAPERSSRSDAANGMDPQRIARLRSGACLCAGASCFKQYQRAEISSFLKQYWSSPKSDRDSLLSIAAQHLPASSCARWIFLGQKVSQKCLAKLLGHCHRKLRATAAGRPDMRTLTSGRQAKHAEVHAFFITMYLSVAETLPTGCAPPASHCIRCLACSNLCVLSLVQNKVRPAGACSCSCVGWPAPSG